MSEFIQRLDPCTLSISAFMAGLAFIECWSTVDSLAPRAAYLVTFELRLARVIAAM